MHVYCMVLWGEVYDIRLNHTLCWDPFPWKGGTKLLLLCLITEAVMNQLDLSGTTDTNKAQALEAHPCWRISSIGRTKLQSRCIVSTPFSAVGLQVGLRRNQILRVIR